MEETIMKPVGLIGAGVLLLSLGVVAPLYAQQDEHHEEAAKAPKQEQAKPEKQQEQAKSVNQEEQAKPQKQEEAKAPKQEEQATKAQQEQAKSNNERQEQQTKVTSQEQNRQAKTQEEQTKSNNQRQEQQAKVQGHEQHAQRTAAEEQRQRAVPALRLSVRGQGRIPDDRFRSNFGSDHRFHIGAPVMVGGYSRFQYGGYWFGFVEPWPVGWYYTDDVYVNYVDGGYYLYNPYYPDTRVSINVVL
jgi:hypothetical protein